MMNNYSPFKATHLMLLWVISAFCLVIQQASAQANWPRVQAETFLSQAGGTTPVVTENSGATVGYFEEKGETLRYRISVPTTGFYSLSYKYLAGEGGFFIARTASGAEGYAEFKAVVNPNGGWWLMPLASWPTQTSSTLFYLEAGVQDLYLINQGKGVNFDYLEFTLSANQSIAVDSIQLTPSSLEVKPNHTLTIQARAKAGNTVVAAPIVWSNNATGGVYKAGAAGADSITVSTGAISKTVPVAIQMPRAKYQFLVSQHGALRVQSSGEGFVDKSGRIASFAGPSWFWSDSSLSYWTKDMVRFFVQDWKAGLVRLPMSIAPGRFCDSTSTDAASTCFNIAAGDLSKDPKTGERGVTWNNDNYFRSPEASLNLMKDMIDEAIENDIYVVVDFHEHHAGKLVPEAKSFFEEIARLYGQYPNVMFEIYNEPLPYYDWNAIAAYAREVIPVIRKYSSNPIIVGTRMWSQRIDEVDGQLTGYGNIAYTLHYYAATHGTSLVSKMDLGKPVMITESGNDGAAMWDYINKARTKGISWASWAVNNKGGMDAAWSIFTDSNTNFTGPWLESDLSAAGKTQRDIIKSWPRVQDSPIALCNDTALASVKFVINGVVYEPGASVTVDQGDSLTIGAKGFSSCKELAPLAVDNTSVVQWSANAPKGVFSASTIDTYAVTLTNLNPRVTANLTVKVVAPRPFSQKIEAEAYAQMNGIQLETTTDVGGGQNCGYIDTGDTMTYSVTLPKAGSYKMSYRVAAKSALGMFEVRANQNLVEVVQFNPTGDWQNWTTVTTTVDLPAGKVDLVLKATSSGWNINWLQIDAVQVASSSSVTTSVSSSSVPTTSSSVPTTSSSVPTTSSSVPTTSSSVPTTSSSVPTTSSSVPKTSSSVSSSSVANVGVTIQAESYAIAQGVQLESTVDVGGGSNVGWIDGGDWMSFTNSAITVPSTGSYLIEFRVASNTNGASLAFEEAGGSPVYAVVPIQNTNGWQNWTTVSTTVTLSAGTHKFGIAAKTGGWNINWFRVTRLN